MTEFMSKRCRGKRYFTRISVKDVFFQTHAASHSADIIKTDSLGISVSFEHKVYFMNEHLSSREPVSTGFSDADIGFFFFFLFGRNAFKKHLNPHKIKNKNR